MNHQESSDSILEIAKDIYKGQKSERGAQAFKDYIVKFKKEYDFYYG